MQQQDQSEHIEISADPTANATEKEDETASTDQVPAEEEMTQPGTRRFDWPALGAALVVAVFFALTARFNNQPSPSYIPAAVFSATGCGLLVTAIRKLRGLPGAGLREAALSGLGMALLQFAVTFTYPDVFSIVTTVPSYSGPFLVTWGLVALFAIAFNLAGATIGHLVFSPQRPLPASQQESQEEDEDEDNEEEETRAEVSQEEHSQGTAADRDEEEEDESDEDELPLEAATVAPSRRSLPGYIIAVLLLGLLPMMSGYVFAATYDFILNAMNVNAISPALYPTLSLLSGLLPWRLAAPINLTSANGSFIVFTLLWRVPDSVLGNPNLFDVQALESLVFSATALALLLITRYNVETGKQQRTAPWGIFLLLEALLGLIIILPANLWLLRGLEGILQFESLLAQLPTIQLLNPLLFTLNLLTGILFCLIVGLIVRRQYQLWTLPRARTTEARQDEETAV